MKFMKDSNLNLFFLKWDREIYCKFFIKMSLWNKFKYFMWGKICFIVV